MYIVTSPLIEREHYANDRVSGKRGRQSTDSYRVNFWSPARALKKHVIEIDRAHHLQTLLPKERQQAWGMLLVDYMILLTGSRFLKTTENREDFSVGVKGFFSSIKRKYFIVKSKMSSVMFEY